jgi:hypothetical protein
MAPPTERRGPAGTTADARRRAMTRAMQFRLRDLVEIRAILDDARQAADANDSKKASALVEATQRLVDTKQQALQDALKLAAGGGDADGDGDGDGTPPTEGGQPNGDGTTPPADSSTDEESVPKSRM